MFVLERQWIHHKKTPSDTSIGAIKSHEKMYHILLLSVLHQGIINSTLTFIACAPWHVSYNSKVIHVFLARV